MELRKAYIQQETAIAVARIGAGKTDGAEEEGIAVEGSEEDEDMKNSKEILSKMEQLITHLTKPQPDVAGAITHLANAHTQSTLALMADHAKSIDKLHQAVSSEKEIVRDPKTGTPTGVRIKQAIN